MGKGQPVRSSGLRLVMVGVAIVGCLGALVAAELVLRATGKYMTRGERTSRSSGLGRALAPEKHLEPWLWTLRPNIPDVHVSEEFSTHFAVNADGWTGPQTSVGKGVRELRIFAVGDSFTQGIGANAEESYPTVLEKLLLSRHGRRTKVRVVNAGVRGSDPIFGLQLIERRIIQYQPDLVLLSFMRGDISDLERRGGFDRFTPEGWMKPLPRPFWAPLVGPSLLARAFFFGGLGYNSEFHSPEQSKMLRLQASRTLVEAGERFRSLGRTHGFRALPLFIPYPTELESRSYISDIRTTMKGFDERGLEYLDLLPLMLREAGGSCAECAWNFDLHYTPHGYALIARVLKEALERHKFLSSTRITSRSLK